MKLVIINYGAGNIQSIKFAFERLGVHAILSDDADVIKAADKVIFPGVGEASSAMAKLKATGLDKVIPTLKQPVLGICLGMQLMCNHSTEGDTTGLGIFDVDVVKFSNKVKVPQIGWNEIESLKTPLFKDIPEHSFMYLVHSFYAPKCDAMIASTNYEVDYASALQKDNFYGVQFHPEKSGKVGQEILKNFCQL
ncbi:MULTISPECIES: imidazole glycerol phosphate synthase subunit HisH [Leeuwenhoekiella]|jgi:glutamine amidotransferase|uniref:Imidazole glycerol phosphate synthase subunit HisH n=1 Tax=Leeuwenhoekiella blandensis (strain CECT 7118 / CCUG 51940 / KCTC 22103 / MED217) TaxID=398720 RepID=A3XP50_LEEBM|nr:MULTISPECIES: imidazole glycerol phosphate synthase subunit HisH [Leeuwenhoekiella]EAQ48672.1 imidazole glycerol phosphate synthase subunit hisH [Leeuwenhoekiella blandensis MED217]MAO45126.1 imidazole glycerol phosphate synthase subunit HisH [Leeuwenhoekiella sp.]MBQ52696.1 imidazole glycerol phosphate synthase subunit HisH [Leeuwenhoekiella sp.]|tara:strand:+ start:1026 stop:1607 length:582 start_codon:yes stop_codon:yes gene_type:complete